MKVLGQNPYTVSWLVAKHVASISSRIEKGQSCTSIHTCTSILIGYLARNEASG